MKVCFEIKDEKVSKALCGLSALIGESVSDIVAKGSCIDEIVKGMAEDVKDDPIVLGIVERDNLHAPFKDLMAVLEK